MYPIQCTRPFQCTHSVPGQTGWTRAAANYVGWKRMPKWLILRELWKVGRRARTTKNGAGRTDGAQGRNRTTDTVIFSHVLYQLSYLGAGPAGAGGSQSAGRYTG